MRGYISKLHMATSLHDIAGDGKIELSHAVQKLNILMRTNV